eukprot:840157-Amphidinium_carterae.2
MPPPSSRTVLASTKNRASPRTVERKKKWQMEMTTTSPWTKIDPEPQPKFPRKKATTEVPSSLPPNGAQEGLVIRLRDAEDAAEELSRDEAELVNGKYPVPPSLPLGTWSLCKFGEPVGFRRFKSPLVTWVLIDAQWSVWRNPVQQKRISSFRVSMTWTCALGLPAHVKARIVKSPFSVGPYGAAVGSMSAQHMKDLRASAGGALTRLS